MTHDFDAAAAEWDDNPRRIELARTVAEAVREDAPPPEGCVALDCGCGTGLVSFFLRGAPSRIVCADASQGMLDVLAEKAAAAGATEMETLRLDLSVDAPPEGAFDAAWSSMAFHHIDDVDAALAGLRAALRPGGRLCIADLEEEDGSFHGDAGSPHHGFDPDALARRVAAAGFVDPTWRTILAFRKGEPGGDPDAAEGPEFRIFLLVATRP